MVGEGLVDDQQLSGRTWVSPTVGEGVLDDAGVAGGVGEVDVEPAAVGENARPSSPCSPPAETLPLRSSAVVGSPPSRIPTTLPPFWAT